MESQKKQSNHHFQYSVLIQNSQWKVWAFLSNVERWPEWDTELKSASLSQKFNLGARGRLVPRKGPRLNFHISELVPNNSYTFVTKMPVGTLEIKRTLKSKGDLIEFTDEVKFTGFFKRFFGLILGNAFQSVIPEVMQNFKEIAEKE